MGLRPAFAIDLDGPFAFLNADARGGTGPNGRPSLSPTAAGAQLTRSNLSWLNEGGVLGAATTVTYAFRSTAPDAMPEGTSGFTRFSEIQINMTLLALDSWSDVANLVFVRVGAGATGDAAFSNDASILFANHGTVTESGAAFAFLPGNRASSSIAGDVWVNIGLEANQTGVVFEYGRLTMVHEIGHAIGLDHPADYNAGQGSPNYTAHAIYYEDTIQYSIMSYFEETFTGANFSLAGRQYYAAAPLMDDIMAAQRLYGANMTTRTGDTVYGFNSTAGRDWFHVANASQGAVFCVWDAGGVDTFDFSGYSQNQTIDLRAGAFSSVGGLVGNVAIAIGVTIENALGGAGNDTLIGNAANNIFRGGGGNDTMNGGAGFDTAVYVGVRLQYVASSTSVSGNGEGTDTLISIEQARFVDGVLSFDVAGVSAQVMRLYSATLNRTPDQGGLEANVGALGVIGLQGLADAFVGSPEFQSRFGALNNQQFVEQLYVFALGRTGDPAGIAHWVGALNAGAGRGQIVVGFSESLENQARTAATLNAGLWVPDQQALIIARLYDATFKRLPDVAGLSGWVNALKGGTSVTDIAAAFAGSAEFQATFGALSNQAFVEQLYRFCLNREGDAGGIAGWVAELNGGASRASVLLGFSESAEHIALTANLWLGGIRFAGFVGAPEADADKDNGDTVQTLPVPVDDKVGADEGRLINGETYEPADIVIGLKRPADDAFVLPSAKDLGPLILPDEDDLPEAIDLLPDLAAFAAGVRGGHVMLTLDLDGAIVPEPETPWDRPGHGLWWH